MSLETLRESFPAIADSKHVIITEVTRMTGGMVCVAGVDLHTSALVRPLQPGGYNWEETKWVSNNPHFFRVGNLVRLQEGTAIAREQPHGNEDFIVKTVYLLQQCTPSELYQACTANHTDDITAYFNDKLRDRKYVEQFSNCPSLGCFIISKDAIRLSDRYNAVQVSFPQDEGWYNLKVTDLVCKSQANSTAGMAYVQSTLDAANQRVAIRIGLARPWKGRSGEYDPRRCFLQINGIIART